MPKSFTSSYIAFTPKRDNPTSFFDYWSITLCTFASKIITEVLAIRLNRLLPHIIADNQASFVKGWNITDNVLVALS